MRFITDSLLKFLTHLLLKVTNRTVTFVFAS